jgi:HlyD family secretion protein
MTRIAKQAVVVCAALLAAGGFGAMRFKRTQNSVPTAEVRKGDFIDYLEVRGEISAENSVTISAPMRAGDLQILKLVKNGTVVKKGDIVVQFDTTTVAQTLEQRRAELKSAEADVARTRAQARLDREQKITDTLKAKYDVQRAELDASKQEILSEIDGAKSKLTLADMQQKLRESEQKVKSSETSAEADTESKKQKQRKVLFDIKLAEEQIASMTIKTPVDGIVTLSPNWRGRGASEFKEGDRAWAGAKVAEIPDLRSIRMTARVDETDRGPLKNRQPVLIRIDAIPDREFKGAVAEISAIAKPDFSGWPPVKNFDLVVGVADSDARIRPGMNANARVVLGMTKDAVIVPAEAVFQKSGMAVVFVLGRRGFDQRTVTVGKSNKAEAMIAVGLKPGERVALKDPTQESGK